MRCGRLGTALALVALVTSSLPLECVPGCHKREGGRGIQRDHVQRDCPVELSSVRPPASGGTYSERITVRVWMTAEDLRQKPRIEILSATGLIVLQPFRKRQTKSKNKRQEGETCVECSSRAGGSVWELVYNCLDAEAGTVTASYNTASQSCRVNYTVPDPVPDFDLSVNHSSKSISVTVVGPGHKVKARWCYRKHGKACVAEDSLPIEIDPSVSPFGLLNPRYLLPCVCVQVYYTHADARRHVKCPFRNESLPDVRDVLRSSKDTLYESGLKWSSPCSARELNVSASLCWRQHQHQHPCTPVPNSTLQKVEQNGDLMFNTAALDKHPQMCVQFSLQGSNNISCPFSRDMSSWEVSYGPGRRAVILYLASSAPATFSAQLCVLTPRGCAPEGHVHAATVGSNSSGTAIRVPLHLLAEQPCVQVWQSDPALRGRRVLCPDYAHHRHGLYAVAAVVFVVVVSFLGVLIRRLTKSGASGWLCIQEPVLLVCSSEQSAHISAVCSLASILQGELRATVHTALWSQGSRTQAGPGVADLGPLPWLYGQWGAVRKARGKVLIIWSPEATETYRRRSEERASVAEGEGAQPERGGTRATVGEGGGRVGKHEKRAAGERAKSRGEKDRSQWEPSAVIAPVFTAALACLEAALQEGKGQGVALVYFQGLCHRRDIPKTFKGLPRYCLPQDFRGLIQELVGTSRRAGSGEPGGRRWPRLVSKALAAWLAQRLTRRLQALRGPTRGGLGAARPGGAGELEPLRGSPRRAEEL
ncbi:interleukin-17 receptor E isoform X2 [Pungitius pungitius]|uniref:interleukin-17 receptor E isoform X2 n=1 Tax=Pungitius pungitius TaxID=134920 RepID=UPI002E161D82